VRSFLDHLEVVCRYLTSARPTAVNLPWAMERIVRVARESAGEAIGGASRDARMGVAALKKRVLEEGLAMLEEDRGVCRRIGEIGLDVLAPLATAGKPIGILTHCNAGGLATVQYGTALAPMYVGAERGVRFHVYSDETRPLLQGSRITAFELKANGVPVTVICDNMAATVMREGKIDAVIVGTDRVAANGDVANKIGTFGVAILAKYFGIPFYVAAPISSIDGALATGAGIPIEQRDGREVTHGFGRQTAPDGVDVFNPAFDVTPAELVTALITERGVLRAPYGSAIAGLLGEKSH
jgi:methylthioribose-1-phosphate isomerase